MTIYFLVIHFFYTQISKADKVKENKGYSFPNSFEVGVPSSSSSNSTHFILIILTEKDLQNAISPFQHSLLNDVQKKNQQTKNQPNKQKKP